MEEAEETRGGLESFIVSGDEGEKINARGVQKMKFTGLGI